MDIVLMILYATIVLGFLVFIHEGGHYLAARAFGVRVTEFMLGLPGPSVGFTRAGTRFGVTAVPLGGYAKVCGMEAGEMSPHLEQVLAALYRRGTANMEDIAADCGITDDEAFDALDELAEWGSVVGPTKKDQYNTYRAPAVRPAKKQIAAAEAAGRPTPAAFELGEARPVENPHDLFESEYRQQYRSLPFWKRSVILVAGVAMNLLFAILLFIVWLCVIGMDVQTAAGEIVHVNLNPLQAIQFGFMYVGAVSDGGACSTLQRRHRPCPIRRRSSASRPCPRTSSRRDWSSILQFFAMISVSLGVMNLLPIPPLDGGRLVVEVFQKLTRKVVSTRALNYLSAAGMLLFLGFFLVMANQDIQRYVFGNWG